MIETILKELNTLPSDEGGTCVERMHPTDIDKVNDLLTSSLKALLESLDRELEGEKKDIKLDGEIWEFGFNSALNLAQEKLRKLIK